MIKCGRGKRIVLALLIICLCFSLVISSGCKKKEQTEEARQAVPVKEAMEVSVSKDIEPAQSPEKIDLRILYAGMPGTKRTKEFVGLLKKHFKKVETTNYKTFKGKESVDFDVTIIDYDGVKFEAPRIFLSRQYSRATVTMGVPGAFLCSDLSLKIGYL